jgi:hypothetical protein
MDLAVEVSVDSPVKGNCQLSSSSSLSKYSNDLNEDSITGYILPMYTHLSRDQRYGCLGD